MVYGRKEDKRDYKRKASPAVKKASRKELKEFVGGWKGKLSIPPMWITKNLSMARLRLRFKL